MKKQFKRILSFWPLLFLMILIWVNPFTSHAQVRAARELQWTEKEGHKGYKGYISFKVDQDVGYEEINLYRSDLDGKNERSVSGIKFHRDKPVSDEYIKETETHDLSRSIKESGIYYFTVTTYKSDSKEDIAKGGVLSEKSPVYIYHKPDKQLVAQNLRWSETTPGLAEWDDIPDVGNVSIHLYSEEGRYIYGVVTSGYGSSYDLSEEIGDSEDTYYYFTVRPYSANIEKVTHGEESVPSPLYDGEKVIEGVPDTSSGVSKMRNADSPDEAKRILASFVNSINKTALAIEMQSKSEVRNEVASMESDYKSKANVGFTKNVSKDTGLDASKVNILGGCLNAKPNENVQFSISLTGPSAKKAINTKTYRDVIQFDMNITGGSYILSDYESDAKLAVPVVVTMPVPKGMKPGNLKILHFHKNGVTYDLITPRNNSDGTISFTITHLSTFAFVEENSEEDVIGKTFKDKNGLQYKILSKFEASVISGNKKATSITVPKTVSYENKKYKVVKIEKNAFKNYKSLKKASIGANVKILEENAFYGCTKLASVSIGSSVSIIGKKAFYNCSSLKALTLPASVTTLDGQFIGKCKNLKTLTIKSTKMVNKGVSNKAFLGAGSKVVIKVPKAKVNAYKKLFKKKGLSKKITIKAGKN